MYWWTNNVIIDLSIFKIAPDNNHYTIEMYSTQHHNVTVKRAFWLYCLANYLFITKDCIFESRFGAATTHILPTYNALSSSSSSRRMSRSLTVCGFKKTSIAMTCAQLCATQTVLTACTVVCAANYTCA